jgi:hypothetical protein
MVDPQLANNSATDDDTLVCFGETVIIPDGRVTSSSIAGGATAWFGAGLKIGNSYSLEFENTSGDTTPPGLLAVFSGDDGCLGPSTMSPRDTTDVDPGTGSPSRRVSFRAEGTEAFYWMSLANGSGSAISYTFGLSDTTMYSASWSTNGAFNAYYSFQNTTGTDLAGRLTLLDTAGAVVTTFDVSLPAGQTVSTNTLSLGVARNRTGTAKFTHDGPPGSIVVEAAIASFALSPAYVQPVKFQPVREAR